MKKIRVGIVEDQNLFREGLIAIMRDWPEVEIVLEAADAFACQESLKENRPDVLVVDLNLPDRNGEKCSGADLTVHVRDKYPEIKVIILSVHYEDKYIAHCVECGAHSYLAKGSDALEVRESINMVIQKGHYLNAMALRAIQNGLTKKIQQKTLDTSMPVYLTPREKEILVLTCKQLTAEEIGDVLSISAKTVNGHRNNLLQKTGARNAAGLVVFAVQNKLFDVHLS